MLRFFNMFSDRAQKRVADRLFRDSVVQARHVWFYREARVPDTTAGRFDMITLHLFLLSDRLRAMGDDGSELERLLAERFIDELDITFREMGTGDMGVGPKVRKLAQQFYNRLSRYRAGMGEGPEALVSELHDILFNHAPERQADAERIAAYLLRARHHLAGLTDEALQKGEVTFPAPA